jgi:hypothetical protein
MNPMKDAAPRLCPGCRTVFMPVPAARRYCRPSCRARFEAEQRRGQETPALTFDSELPSAEEVAEFCRRRDAIARLYSRSTP